MLRYLKNIYKRIKENKLLNFLILELELFQFYKYLLYQNLDAH
jgi:hypothetical protein